ncbi:FAD-binding protein [Ponticoccus sp. SC2-23]|uniref:FAD-binding oxidoreductase n=1 Tax=Alexandriicola marinus TaxID=2081710 RepID=UPI000FD8698A|nr:FAD-linked oxidase C-terminal domain-containing protein [Alexandriicola marinus]MBM1221694.1 FAD-binding protein [Ponticoccus sp. SC6-9]MBM1226045.1 FAD-binding protein [Ponticoccus sp. SC6-15]MBM1231342.1 FAD-binding protein [Ponticoccus sp. SC6-38]MBM1235797.1 FAD-binding protein [Ponticoccus sp. SC6-45]MBM1240365.1 FAD-binding protein [Ponticoccus sp. SC6-49]MBM1244900.1 FAD-binding protein [Ponticoccus sp. SC2-64]MBM1249271.1 FAD-binding protein [Ponticoccus sp. SC6-42]MBM1253318.1 F
MADGVTRQTHDDAIARIAEMLGARLVTSAADRAHHGQNETDFPETLPDAVAYPETTEEVSRILAICNAAGCPVTPFGAGSALEGQHLAQAGGISLDLSRMNQVLAVNPEDLNVVIQPGLRRVALNEELRATGLFFPVDPGADASLGGMAATRASGTTAVRYGTMRDNILALEAVMADGTVIRSGSRARKSSTGYDLTHLLIGSEGTLGVITELTLKLQGIPEAVTAATCRFDTVEDAVNCVILTVQSGLPMARIELVDEVMVQGFNLYSDAGLPEKPHLFLEFTGTPASVAEQTALFEEIAGEFSVDGWSSATKTEDRNALWSMRHNAHYACQALAGPGRRIRSTDVCVPISRLAEAVTTAQRLARDGGLTATIVGHVGDGNFHCGVVVDPTDPASVAQVAEFSHTIAHLALDLGGTVSGEHGIGLGKLDLMSREHGPALAYMRSIKAAFDPNGILNPGKLLPPASAKETLS